MSELRFLSHPVTNLNLAGHDEHNGGEMAIRTEALRSPQQRAGLPNRTPEVAADATVYRFPTASVRRRAAAQRRRQNLLRSLVGIAVFVALLVGAAKVSAPPEVASRPSAPGSVIGRKGSEPVTGRTTLTEPMG